MSIDEIHLCKQILPYKDGFIGFEDYGDKADKKENPKEATAALFVMANEVNGSNKIPLRYILTNGISRETIGQVIMNSIKKINIINARVLSLTFDGLPSNLRAVEMLGANLDVLSPDFRPNIVDDEGNKIYVLLDASNMLKLVRNFFKDYGTIVDTDGRVVSRLFSPFRYLVNTNSLPIFIGNKLVPYHTAPRYTTKTRTPGRE